MRILLVLIPLIVLFACSASQTKPEVQTLPKSGRHG